MSSEAEDKIGFIYIWKKGDLYASCGRLYLEGKFREMGDKELCSEGGDIKEILGVLGKLRTMCGRSLFIVVPEDIYRSEGDSLRNSIKFYDDRIAKNRYLVTYIHIRLFIELTDDEGNMVQGREDKYEIRTVGGTYTCSKDSDSPRYSYKQMSEEGKEFLEERELFEENRRKLYNYRGLELGRAGDTTQCDDSHTVLEKFNYLGFDITLSPYFPDRALFYERTFKYDYDKEYVEYLHLLTHSFDGLTDKCGVEMRIVCGSDTTRGFDVPVFLDPKSKYDEESLYDKGFVLFKIERSRIREFFTYSRNMKIFNGNEEGVTAEDDKYVKVILNIELSMTIEKDDGSNFEEKNNICNFKLTISLFNPNSVVPAGSESVSDSPRIIEERRVRLGEIWDHIDNQNRVI